jgi:hypothetical protein
MHMKKQANCLETRNAFTFVIILEASIALEFVSHPMVLSTQNTPSVLRKLWPVPPEQETLWYILGYGVSSDYQMSLIDPMRYGPVATPN